MSLCIAATCSARAEINVETERYTISGTDLRTLVEQIGRKGPGRFSAFTRWNLKYEYDYLETSGQCAISSVDAALDIEYTLPKWADYQSAPEHLQADWDEWYGVLEAHEFAHGAHGEAAYAELTAALQQITAEQDCNALQRSVRKTANEIINRYSGKDRALDRDTNHGADLVSSSNRFITLRPAPGDPRAYRIHQRLAALLVDCGDHFGMVNFQSAAAMSFCFSL